MKCNTLHVCVWCPLLAGEILYLTKCAHHISIARVHRLFFPFLISRMMYDFRVLPSGLVLAPWVLTKFVRSFTVHMNVLSMKAFHHFSLGQLNKLLPVAVPLWCSMCRMVPQLSSSFLSPGYCLWLTFSQVFSLISQNYLGGE